MKIFFERSTNWSLSELFLVLLGILFSVFLHDSFKQILGFYNNQYLLSISFFWGLVLFFYSILLRDKIFKNFDLYFIAKILSLSFAIALLTSNLTVNLIKLYMLKTKAEQIAAKDYILALSIKVPQRTGYECATFRFKSMKSVIPISGKLYSDYVATRDRRFIKVSIKELGDGYAVLQNYSILD